MLLLCITLLSADLVKLSLTAAVLNELGRSVSLFENCLVTSNARPLELSSANGLERSSKWIGPDDLEASLSLSLV
jgi:hypothetical protein